MRQFKGGKAREALFRRRDRDGQAKRSAQGRDLVRPLATAKNLAFHVHVDPAVPDGLLGDEARLRQILGNLLANAVKYTPAGTVILRVSRAADAPTAQLSTLDSRPPNERLAFVVQDTGPGLPADKIPQLFTLFTRLDEGDTFTREGTGVGLALVRRLCDLMGGQVTAGNRLGGGAEFTVTLPFTRATAPAPIGVSPAPVAARVIVNSTGTVVINDAVRLAPAAVSHGKLVIRIDSWTAQN